MAGGRRSRPQAPARSQERFAQIVVVALILVALGIAGYAWTLETASEPQAQPLPAPDVESSLPAIPQGGHTDYAGQVTQVSDGDTVRFRTKGRELRIRIDSIDAPEKTDGVERPGQAYAQASRDYLSQWIRGRHLIARCYEIDQYGRSVCALLDDNGVSAGRAQVAAGYAWAYTAARGRYLRDRAMPELQTRARKARAGLWAQDGATAPWTWRYDCWRERQCH